LQNSIIADGGKALAIKADSADAEPVSAVTATVDAFGQLDILVNNAGVLAVAPLEDSNSKTSTRPWPSTCAACSSPHPGRRPTRPLAVGSSTSAVPMPIACPLPVGAPRHEQVGTGRLTKGLARDLGPKGITINNVQPGPVDTDMNPPTVTSPTA
jgi:3-oxoacyl-[acyl-carrier protein] reductase